MRSRRPPSPLASILPRLAQEAGAQRLRRAGLEAAVGRVLGGWLSRRLVACRRDGQALELEIAGAAAARDVEALADEIVEGLRAELGSGAPRRLRVRVVAAPPASRARVPRGRPSAGPNAGPSGGMGAESTASPRPGPELQRALAGIEDPVLRARLERIASGRP